MPPKLKLLNVYKRQNLQIIKETNNILSQQFYALILIQPHHTKKEKEPCALTVHSCCFADTLIS